MSGFSDYPQLVFVFSKIQDGNMSLLRGDWDEVFKNRQEFVNSLGLSLDSVVSINLLHGTEVIRVGTADLDTKTLAGDGLMTDTTGVYLLMVVADCPAIALFDPEHRAIALIHASRINLEQDIILKAVKLMRENFNSRPERIMAEFSPSIGPCCYRPFEYQAGEKIKNYINRK